jgi:small subunit ribosomal protein S2
MALPSFTMRQLLEAGVHFGHRTGRWNPKMAPFIFGERRNIHVIDLQQTVPLLYRALSAVRDTVAGGGRVLFVGTKRQATEKVAEAAKRCGQHYVNHRWLGGMMTNWKTVSVSMRRLKELEEQLGEDEENLGLTKKELLRLTRERDKLDRALGGIKEMGGLPDILFVIDTNKEHIAVAEANKLGIPVIAVIDSNSDPAGIGHPIPGNDDAVRAINLYCDLVADAVLDGIQQEMLAAGIDVGEGEEAPAEQLDTAPGEAPATATAEMIPPAPQPAAAAPSGAADPAPATAEPAGAPAAAPTPEAPPVAAEGDAKAAPAAVEEVAKEAADEAKAAAKKKPAAKPGGKKTGAEAKTKTKTAKAADDKPGDDKPGDDKKAAGEASQSDDAKKAEKKPAAEESSEKSAAKEGSG